MLEVNETLVQYAYPTDAVLPPLVAKQLAHQLQARAIIISTLSRGDGGRVTVEARVTRTTPVTWSRWTRHPARAWRSSGRRSRIR